jgi:molybdate transport system regulatory protein
MASGARIGPGKAALLESVRSSGSISAAARAMGMDYKRAWLLVDSLNRAFDTPVVERVTGGSGGGGAILTRLAKTCWPVIASWKLGLPKWPLPT